MPKSKRRLVHHRNTIGYWKGGAQGEPRKFQALTNFGLQLLKFIAAPPGLPECFKGYLVRVTQARRSGKGVREGTCFLPWYKVPSVEQLTQILGEALPSSVLQCTITGNELKQLLLDLWHEGAVESSSDSDGESQRMQSRPVHCIGRQEGSDVFVLGPNLQFWKSGKRISDDEQQYIWIPYILKQLRILPTAKPVVELPPVRHPLRNLLRGLQRITGDNFGSALFLVGGAVISLFYESIQSRCGSVAISVAYGPPSGGKTNAVRAAVSACGTPDGGVMAYLSESSTRQKLGMSLPFGLDDPSSTEEKFKKMLITAFGGAVQENQRGTIKPRCVPLVTANLFIIDALTEDDPRYLSRVVLVPFMSFAASVELDYLKSFLKECVAAFPRILQIGSSLEKMDPDQLYKIRDDINLAVGEQLDSRLATHYAFAIASVQEITRKAKLAEFPPEKVMEYFKEVIVPEIRARQISHESTRDVTGLEHLVKCLAEAIPAERKYRLLRVINPTIKYRPSKDSSRKIDGVAIILKDFMSMLNKYDIDHEHESTIRRKLRAMKDIVTSSKQFFLSQHSRESTISRKSSGVRCSTCVCAPRRSFSDETLKLLEQDECDPLDDSGIGGMDYHDVTGLTNDGGAVAHGSWADTEGGDDMSDGEGAEDEADTMEGDDDVSNIEDGETDTEGDDDVSDVEEGEDKADTEDDDVSDIEDGEDKADTEGDGDMSDIGEDKADTEEGDANVDDYMVRGGGGGDDCLGKFPKVLGTPLKKQILRLGISPARYKKAPRLQVYGCRHFSASQYRSPVKRIRKHTRARPPVRRILNFVSTNNDGYLTTLRAKTNQHKEYKRDKGKRLQKSLCEEGGCNHPRARIWVECSTCSGWWHGKCANLRTLKAAKRATFTCKSTLWVFWSQLRSWNAVMTLEVGRGTGQLKLTSEGWQVVKFSFESSQQSTLVKPQ